MNTSLLKNLDLKLAWKRVKLDFSDNKVFVEYPNEVRLFERNIENKIEKLTLQLEENTFTPTHSIICEVPKLGGSTRPAAYLEIEDRIIYTACVGACYEKIYKFIQDEIGLVDFSNPIYKDSSLVTWINPSFGIWDKFRKESLKLIDSFANFVVITDVSACFENIDIKCLIDDLRLIGCDNEVLKLLSKCLNTWAKLEGRGIPQGYGASDILGKFYLSQIDKFLKDNFKHLRYVDDIRIFCSTSIEAKYSLMELVKYLRLRGLNIQTSKTGIYPNEKAKIIIEGIQPIIREIKFEFEKEIVEEFGNPYMNFIEAESVSNNNIDDEPIEVIIRAFDKHFIDNDDSNFDKTLFHFLLKRFSNARNSYAVKFCLHALETHPEETKNILAYFKKLQLTKSKELASIIVHFFASYLVSDRSIYLYQNYLIIKFFVETDFQPTSNLFKVVRKIVFEEKPIEYLTCIGISFLAKYRNNVDFERFILEFSTFSNKSQIEIILALKNMDKIKRNSFYSRIPSTNSIYEDAINTAKM